jgi:hypothetical protein
VSDPAASPQGSPQGSPQSSPLTAALTEELGKKTGVCWLRYGGAEHPAWHVWLDGALCLVSGGPEQPLPGLADVAQVQVVMRSKENGGRLLAWIGDVHVVHPDDEEWDPVTGALVAGRLNLDDLSTAAAQWARESLVVRLVPTGQLAEAPGELPDTALRATPRPTPATTRGPLPKVLHRRAGPGRDLSR